MSTHWPLTVDLTSANHPQTLSSGLQLETSIYTTQIQISAAKTTFTTLLSHVQAIAHDYRQLGSYFHNLSGRDRYHRFASRPRIIQEAVVDFIVSSGREMPEMITILGTCQMVLGRVAALLDIDLESEDVEVNVGLDVGVGELYEVFGMLMQVGQQMGYAWWIMGKLNATIRLYEVILAERLQRGDSREEKDRYRGRQFRQAKQWFNALPEVCFGELPVADPGEERAQVATRVLETVDRALQEEAQVATGQSW